MFVYVDVTAGITVDYVMLALHYRRPSKLWKPSLHMPKKYHFIKIMVQGPAWTLKSQIGSIMSCIGTICSGGNRRMCTQEFTSFGNSWPREIHLPRSLSFVFDNRLSISSTAKCGPFIWIPLLFQKMCL